MKIDTTDYGVFTVEVTQDEVIDWLMNEGTDLIKVNSAIDEAASHAADYGRAFVLIELRKHASTSR